MDMNKLLIGIAVALVLLTGAYFLFQGNESVYMAPDKESVKTEVENAEEQTPVETDNGIGDESQPLDEVLAEQGQTQEVIGKSVQGRDIVAYHYGNGTKEVVFIAGVHGGYSPNTAVLARQAMAYFASGVDETVPADVKVTIIPVVNPDGLQKVVDIDTNEDFRMSDVSGNDTQKVAARFNANDVDLNRNFDCRWKKEGVWQSRKVSGGTSAFSEPEAQAIKTYIEKSNPTAVVVWYASAGGVYASQCDAPTLTQTKELTNIYADASGYTANEKFDSYEVNGDMVNWLAKKGIPAISVLLSDKTNTEWTKNQKGIEAVLNYVAK